MTAYTMILIFGVSSWGAGGMLKYDFPDKESCHEALKVMRIEGNNQVAGDDDEQSIAYCVPKSER